MTSSRLCVDISRHVPLWTHLGSYWTHPAHAPCMWLYQKPGLLVFRSDLDSYQTCTNIRLDDLHHWCGMIGNDSHDRFCACIYTGLVMPSNVKTFTPVPLCVLHRFSLRTSPSIVSPLLPSATTKPHSTFWSKEISWVGFLACCWEVWNGMS